MRGATLVVHEHKLHSAYVAHVQRLCRTCTAPMSHMYSAYVAHKHSHNISFTKLCETNQSHPGRCGELV